jgi:hypothetical protein
MPKFMRKNLPGLIVEAVQFDGSDKSADDITVWIGKDVARVPAGGPGQDMAPALSVNDGNHGPMVAYTGDWIIKGPGDKKPYLVRGPKFAELYSPLKGV